MTKLLTIFIISNVKQKARSKTRKKWSAAIRENKLTFLN
nr:MAG TPA: hypothetical protein [Caudoviricetes sp.]